MSSVIVQKLAERAAHIRALVFDVVFIGSAILEDGPFLVIDAVGYEVGRLRGAAAGTVRAWLRKRRG